MLQPFQPFYFQENYADGEVGTTIEIKAQNRPSIMMTLNQRDDTKSTSYFTEENNESHSQTSLMTSWINDVEIKKFDEDLDNLFVQIRNLSPNAVSMKITISSRLG